MAVEKAVQYLKSRQAGDGSYTNDQRPSEAMPEGATAFAMYALLTAGVEPDEAVIKKGFSYFSSKPFKTVYSASVIILAIDALCRSKYEKSRRDKKDKSPMTAPYSGKPPYLKKARSDDRKLMNDAVQYLVKCQQKTGGWRYPHLQDQDVSNTQYVMFAFNIARKWKINIPVGTYTKMLDFILKSQEKDGPNVKPFPVPGADFSHGKLKKIEKEYYKKLEKERKNQEKTGADADPEAGPRTAADDTHEKLFGYEGKNMKARGWNYLPYNRYKDPQFAWCSKFSGSMTSSGAICLLIAKAAIEKQGAYRKYKSKVDKGIRDGCAWLSKHYEIRTNPGLDYFHFYYLYNLERLGALALLPKIGEHDWYDDGARMLLATQSPSGEWRPGNSTSGYMCDTCFAILFLKRATSPLVQVPEVIWTGKGL
jgi:hypothetical protein